MEQGEEVSQVTRTALLWWNIPILWLVRIVLVMVKSCIAFLQLMVVSC